MRFLMDMVGADRIVVGSDYNFDAGYQKPVDFVDLIPGLTRQERAMILCDNAARILQLQDSSTR
jgi:aminocarboxymuconate-semialdehyde decarboxylase